MPPALADDALPDAAAREDHALQERRLLFVAATRARDELAVTGYGGRSPLLPWRAARLAQRLGAAHHRPPAAELGSVRRDPRGARRAGPRGGGVMGRALTYLRVVPPTA